MYKLWLNVISEVLSIRVYRTSHHYRWK